MPTTSLEGVGGPQTTCTSYWLAINLEVPMTPPVWSFPRPTHSTQENAILNNHSFITWAIPRVISGRVLHAELPYPLLFESGCVTLLPYPGKGHSTELWGADFLLKFPCIGITDEITGHVIEHNLQTLQPSHHMAGRSGDQSSSWGFLGVHSESPHQCNKATPVPQAIIRDKS